MFFNYCRCDFLPFHLIFQRTYVIGHWSNFFSPQNFLSPACWVEILSNRNRFSVFCGFFVSYPTVGNQRLEKKFFHFFQIAGGTPVLFFNVLLKNLFLNFSVLMVKNDWKTLKWARNVVVCSLYRFSGSKDGWQNCYSESFNSLVFSAGTFSS